MRETATTPASPEARTIWVDVLVALFALLSIAILVLESVVEMILLVTGLGLLGTFTAAIAGSVANRAAKGAREEPAADQQLP